MRIRMYMVPIGPVGVGTIFTELVAIVAVAQFFGLERQYQYFGVIGVLFAVALIMFFWLRDTQILLNEELDQWCTDIQPLYKEHGDKLVYLKKPKDQYVAWLRKQWSSRTSEIRKSKFKEFVTAETNKLPIQRIKDGLKEQGVA